MTLAIPRVKPFGWNPDEVLTSPQVTQMDLNISLLDSESDVRRLTANVDFKVSQPLAPSPAFAGNPIMVPLLPSRTVADLGGERLRIPVLLADSSTSTQFLFSGDGSIFSVGGLITPAWSVFHDAIAGRAGEIILTKTASASYQYTTNHGSSWIAAAPFPVVITGAFYGFVNGAHCYLLSSTAGGTGSSPTLTSPTWASALFPGSGATTAQGVEFATDSISTIVACAQVNGESFSRLFRSTDNGLTWFLAQTMAQVGNVVWNKGWSSFVAWDLSGGMYASQDGVTWSVYPSFASSANGFGTGIRSFASAGKTIAKLWGYPIAAPNYFQSGIGLSNDLGQTWVTVPLSHQQSYICGVYGFNNRFYAVSPGFVWQSSPIATQLREI